MINLLPRPAFSDDHIWMLHDGRQAVMVDPGGATPMQSTLDAPGLLLARILVSQISADVSAALHERKNHHR